MTRREYKGGAAPLTLSGSIGTSDTSIGTTGTATGWPTGGGGKFLVVIDRGLATEEKMLCNSRSGNTLSLSSASDRGQDDTAAAAHLAGATVEHALGAIDLDEPNEHINDTAEDHHSQYMKSDGTRHDLATRHLIGTTWASPSAPAAVGTSASAGVATDPARSDHVHASAAATPRGVVDYAEITSSFYPPYPGGANVDVTGLSLTTTTVAGRRYRISVNANAVIENVTAGEAGFVTAYLLKDGTICASGDYQGNKLYSTNSGRISIEFIDKPTAASHTYKLQVSTHEGDGGISAAAWSPASIMIEDIGI